MVNIKRTITFLFILGALVYPTLLFAWEGKVVGVTDGDTIKVLKDGIQVKIRLGINRLPRERPAME